MINQDILDDLDELDNGDDQQQSIQEESPNQCSDGQGNHEQIKLQQSEMNNNTGNKHSRLLTVNRDRFLQHMQKINQRIDEKIAKNQPIKQEYVQKQEKQKIIQEINKCNSYAVQINKQTTAISKFIKKIYEKRIPQLQSIVTNDGLYCRAVVQIEEHQGRTQQCGDNKKEMFYFLSPHLRISLKISISSPREPLTKQQQQEVLAAAKIVIELQNHYQVLMMFLETCMNLVAPNLCQLVGSVISSKLIATAGGIDKLAAMPACNIQVMGGSRSSQIGLSQLERNHTGIFGQMDVVKDAPKKFQMQLVRMLATNTAKCARADYLGSNNGQGAKLRDEMYGRFEKIQEEGGLTSQEKPLDIPDMQPKKKRGGKRYRKIKQLYEMSELHKQQNRLKFGEEGEQEIEDGVGLGMLKTGMGKLKINIKKQKMRVSKKMEQRMNKKSGLQSSLNINAHQGIQLINPALSLLQTQQKGTDSYFAKQAGFRTVINNKIGK